MHPDAHEAEGWPTRMLHGGTHDVEVSSALPMWASFPNADPYTTSNAAPYTTSNATANTTATITADATGDTRLASTGRF